MYVYMYIYIHTYILEQGSWLDLKQGANHSETVRRKSALTWNRTWTWKKCDINRLQWFRMETVRCGSPGLLGTHYSLALPRVTLQTLALWVQRRFSEKSGENGPWLIVPYGSRSDEKWSRIYIYKRVMVPWVVRNGPNIYSHLCCARCWQTHPTRAHLSGSVACLMLLLERISNVPSGTTLSWQCSLSTKNAMYEALGLCHCCLFSGLVEHCFPREGAK